MFPLRCELRFFIPGATRRNNPEDTILHSHRRENLKSYNIVLSHLEILHSINRLSSVAEK
jgi:hypothetical protein